VHRATPGAGTGAGYGRFGPGHARAPAERRIGRDTGCIPPRTGSRLHRSVPQELQGSQQIRAERRTLHGLVARHPPGLFPVGRGSHDAGRPGSPAGPGAGGLAGPDPRGTQRTPLRERPGRRAASRTTGVPGRVPDALRAFRRRRTPAHRRRTDRSGWPGPRRFRDRHGWRPCFLGRNAFRLLNQRTSMSTTQRLGIIMHGVTGRMGMNQHLIRSIVAIRRQGGVALANGDRVMPDPILVGRNLDKVRALASAHGIDRCTDDLDAALSNPDDTVFFDAGTTQMRPDLLARAIGAGKHIYCEKPIATGLDEALRVCRLAREAGIKHGVVQDKLFLPGLRKLDMLRRSGFFGRMLSVRIAFGYWVFEGDLQPIQRPSWNYRKEDGGGMILDMVCHWRYVLDNLFGEVQSVSCLGATHIPERRDEQGRPYEATADDAAYATFQLKGHGGEPVIAQVN